MSEGYLPPVVVSVVGNAKDFFDTIAEVKATLRDVNAAEATPTIDLNKGPLDVGVAEADAELDAIGQKVVEPTIRPKISMPWGTYTALSAAMGSLGTNPIRGVASPWAQGKGPAAIDAALATWASDQAFANLSHTSTAWKKYAAINTALAAWGNEVAPAIATGAGSAGGGGGRGGILGFLGGLFAGKGGGGGSAGFLGTLGFGQSGIPMLGGMAGLGTIGGLMGFGAEHMLATGLGVLGSAGGAALGGSLLGLGSLGVMGVGMGTDMAGLGQAANDIKGVVAAQNQLSQAIAVYGKNSTQATAAANNLNYVLSDFSPVARGAILQAANMVQQFKALFDKFTGPAEKIGAQIISGGIGTAESFLPTIGKFAATNMGIIQGSLTGKGGLYGWLKNPGAGGGLGIFTDLEKQFTSHLPTAMHALTQFFELFAKTIDTASHYTGHLVTVLNTFFTKWNGADFGRWQAEIGKLIGVFRVWWGFLKQIAITIYDIFKPAAGTGTELIRILTTLLKTFDTWLTGAGKSTMKGLFGIHRQEIQALGKVLIGLLPILEGFLKGFMQLSSNGAAIFTTLLKTATPFLDAIAKSSVGATFLGWAGTLLLIRGRMAGLMKDAKGLGGAMGRGVGMAGYGAIGGMEVGNLMGMKGGALTAMTVGGAGLGFLTQLPAVFRALKALKIGDTLMSLRVNAISAAQGLARLFFSEETVTGASEGMTFAMAALSAVGILAVATGVYLLIHHFGVLPGLLIAGAAAVVGLTIAMWALDAVPIVALIVGIVLVIAGLVAGIIELVRHWSQVWSDIKQWTMDGVHAVEGWFTQMWGDITRVSEQIWRAVSGFFEHMWHDVVQWVRDLWNDVVHFFEMLWTDVVKSVQQGIRTVVFFFFLLPKQVLATLGHWLSDMFSFGVTLMEHLVSGVESMAGRVGSAIGGALKGAVNSIPLVGGLAKHIGFAGGTMNAPGGMAMVGERGPELMYVPHGSRVYPADKTRQMMRGMGGNHYESNVYVTSQADPYTIGNEVGWQLSHLTAGVG